MYYSFFPILNRILELLVIQFRRQYPSTSTSTTNDDDDDDDDDDNDDSDENGDVDFEKTREKIMSNAHQEDYPFRDEKKDSSNAAIRTYSWTSMWT